MALAIDSLVPADSAWTSSRWVRALGAVVVAINVGAYALRMWIPLEPQIDVQAAVYHSPLRTVIFVGEGGDPFVMYGLQSYWYRPRGLTLVRAADVADAHRRAAALGGALIATRYPVVPDSMTGGCRLIQESVEARHPVLFSRDLLEPLTPSRVRDPWWWFVASCGGRRAAVTADP